MKLLDSYSDFAMTCVFFWSNVKPIPIGSSKNNKLVIVIKRSKVENSQYFSK